MKFEKTNTSILDKMETPEMYLLNLKDGIHPFNCIRPFNTVAEEQKWDVKYDRSVSIPSKALLIECSAEVAEKIEKYGFEWLQTVQKDKPLWFSIVMDDSNVEILE